MPYSFPGSRFSVLVLSNLNFGMWKNIRTRVCLEYFSLLSLPFSLSLPLCSQFSGHSRGVFTQVPSRGDSISDLPGTAGAPSPSLSLFLSLSFSLSLSLSLSFSPLPLYLVALTHYIQWNLLIMDTLGTSILSIVQGLSLLRR